MAAIETRPYKTAYSSSVDTVISVVSPELAGTRLANVWQTGHDIEFEFQATVNENFWRETDIPKNKEITVVGIVSCPVARKRWTTRKTISFSYANIPISLPLKIPGNEIAHELRVVLWLVGPGVVGNGAVHEGAKLWELKNQLIYSLESKDQEFPISAISFAESGRPNLPWVVEIDPEAEPGWNIQSCLRLYLNTDLPITKDILDEKAPADTYTQITHDIYFATIQYIAQWTGRDSYHLDELEQIAEDNYESLAALATTASEKIGVSLGNAISRVHENPYSLLLSLRETFPLYQENK